MPTRTPADWPDGFHPLGDDAPPNMADATPMAQGASDEELRAAQEAALKEGGFLEQFSVGEQNRAADPASDVLPEGLEPTGPYPVPARFMFTPASGPVAPVDVAVAPPERWSAQRITLTAGQAPQKLADRADNRRTLTIRVETASPAGAYLSPAAESLMGPANAPGATSSCYFLDADDPPLLLTHREAVWAILSGAGPVIVTVIAEYDGDKLARTSADATA